MSTRKVDVRRLFAWPLFLCVTVACSGQIALGQFGAISVAAPARNDAPERVLFPQGLPGVEVMLRAALDRHPDVLAARSKLQAAQAEQRQAELRALKEIMELRDRWEQAKSLTAAVGKGNPTDLRTALINQSAIEWELAFVLGTGGEFLGGPKAAGDEGKPASTNPPATNVAPIVIASVIPTKEQATPIREKLQKKIEVTITEMPLKEVARYFSVESGLRFVLDEQGLEESGISVDEPVTCELGEIELVSAIQAMEDLKEPLCFIVRDYGICVTTKARHSWKTVSVWDFVKLSDQELQEKLQQQRHEVESQNNAGRGGGGFF